MTEHKQVRVQVNDEVAKIDQGIAPLIRELWRAGIETVNSCQENKPGIMWIEFLTPQDANRFLQIVINYDDDELYGRMTSNDLEPWAWQYDLLVNDAGPEFVRDYDSGEPSKRPFVVFSVSVRFPVSDYRAVLERMKRRNARFKCPQHPADGPPSIPPSTPGAGPETERLTGQPSGLPQ